mmetsp:Transcript_33269/g.51025  ORF Transcript_33269/g.51025 Transcript_33269/m.51025 type:complete len:104 (+) Transcript_33269:1663-1974(+)
MLSMINPDQLSRYEGNFNHGSQEGLQNGGGYNDQNTNMMDSGGKTQYQRVGLGGGLPHNGKTATGFNPSYKQGIDVNRPGSAQVKPHRPITRGGGKPTRKAYH